MFGYEEFSLGMNDCVCIVLCDGPARSQDSLGIHLIMNEWMNERMTVLYDYVKL